MTLKSYLLLMSVASASCWSVFVFVVSTIDPLSTNWLGFLLFYCSFILSVAGTFSIFGFLVRFKILKRTLAFRQAAESFRQSFLISLLSAAVLFLSSRSLLSWINLALLVAGISLLEYFWVSRARAKIIRPR
jgi:hypothetical protein